MDLWVVAAAAGAGYLAKYWQNILRDREGSSGVPSGSSFYDNPESPSLVQHISDKTCLNHKLSSRKKDNHSHTETDRNSSEGVYAGTSRQDGPLPIKDGKHEHVCMPSSSKYENFEDYKGGNRMNSDGGYIPECHTWETTVSNSSRRSRKTLRSKHLNLQFIKPRSSLDSCLMAQMYREHAELEEYLLSPLASPCTPTLRPFLVTDGRQVVSRASGHFRDRLHKEVYPKADDGVVGVPPLPQIRAPDYSKEKLKKGMKRAAISNNASSLVQFDSQGSSNGQVLFCLGISIGVMSAILASKLELEKLKDSLKQSEGLVQDLQEELEMKDSITVKELAYDDDSQGTHENLCSDKKVDIFSNQVDTTVLTKCADEVSETVKEVESMSKIEAELEAELERLELSMKVSSLHGMLTDGIEDYDEDVMADLVHGELNADIIQQKSCSEPTPDHGSSSTSTLLSVKQGVSPRELSLRLHEVIQTRLKERITELEVELAKSRKHVRDLEAERVNSGREVSNSESSSTLGSPMAVEAQSPMTRPLVMNLSGDALDAYNEAFEELNKLKVSQNEADSQQCNPPSSHLGTYQRQNGTQDCTMTLVAGEEPLPNVRTRISLNGSSPNGDEVRDDSDDDLLLIQQIVEKARQGSPAVLRAQRAIFG